LLVVSGKKVGHYLVEVAAQYWQHFIFRGIQERNYFVKNRVVRPLRLIYCTFIGVIDIFVLRFGYDTFYKRVFRLLFCLCLIPALKDGNNNVFALSEDVVRNEWKLLRDIVGLRV
jgi:hypothetical protein